MKDRELHEAIDQFTHAKVLLDEATGAKRRALLAYGEASERLRKAAGFGVGGRKQIVVKHGGQPMLVGFLEQSELAVIPVKIVE